MPINWRGLRVIEGCREVILAPASHSVVIARLDRAIQYSETFVIEHNGRSVLDHPPSRVMTSCGRPMS
jgi:hypothetical protein